MIGICLFNDLQTKMKNFCTFYFIFGLGKKLVLRRAFVWPAVASQLVVLGLESRPNCYQDNIAERWENVRFIDKVWLTGQNQGQGFTFKSGRMHAKHLCCYETKLPNLKLKTKPEQYLGYLQLDTTHIIIDVIICLKLRLI